MLLLFTPSESRDEKEFESNSFLGVTRCYRLPQVLKDEIANQGVEKELERS